MPMESADVVVIGGGVSGLSSAYFLAKAGKDVVVVEKGTAGGEASGRNGGMISERVDEPPMIPLGVESVRLWETLDDELGYPTEFTQQGRLQVAVSEEEMGEIFSDRDQALRHGVSVDMLDPSEIRDMIPGITGRTLGGMYSPNGGHANPQRSVQAFAWAFQDMGGRLHQNTAVTGIQVVDGRVSSVETTAGAIEADVVVAAAGPQTALLAEMVGVHVPVAPARVEILATAPLEPLFDIALVGNGLYGRQAARGNLLFGGGPHEWADVGLTSGAQQAQHALDQEHRQAARRAASRSGGRAGDPKLGRDRGAGPGLHADHRRPGISQQLRGRDRVGPWIRHLARDGQGRERPGALRRVEHRHQRPWAGPVCRRNAGLEGGTRLGPCPGAGLSPSHEDMCRWRAVLSTRSGDANGLIFAVFQLGERDEAQAQGRLR